MRFKNGFAFQTAVVSLITALISDGDKTPSAARDRRRNNDSFSLELMENFFSVEER